MKRTMAESPTGPGNLTRYTINLEVPEHLEQFTEDLLAVTERQLQLLIEKQLSYGPGNINAFGEYGVLVRMNDKIERLKHIYNNYESVAPTHESTDDSWLDIGNYALIAQMLREGVWPK